MKRLETIMTTVLILLWVGAAGTKLADMHGFKEQLAKQVFSKSFIAFLHPAVPLAEMLAAILLVWPRTRLAGFAFSALLMASFTGYIGLVLVGYFESVPCACIGLIGGMGFKSHLFFNLFFVAVALAGLISKTNNYEKVS